ncbi:cwf18-like protein [Niveomyces insectorum RCEF 264]|uniref:Cwf18-like protein n=1 Tax=Niveomyces insectorum RCEF 264 TaxID=1081102 RepID=A0A167M8H8_9HYPO|nr:cwf18-like protein [Niveomyces insectorum RCEF 264]
MSSCTNLSAATDDRKARLAKLRSIKRKQPDDETVAPELNRAAPSVSLSPEPERGEGHFASKELDVSRLHLSGRNYDPESRGARLGFEAPPNLITTKDTLEAKAAELEAEVRGQQNKEERDDELRHGETSKAVDLFKLQPKKPNWDLKRELDKRLELLIIRTDNAIARSVRQRLYGKDQPQHLQRPQQGRAPLANAAAESKSMEEVLEGAALVERIRLREQEDEEERRREWALETT